MAFLSLKQDYSKSVEKIHREYAVEKMEINKDYVLITVEDRVILVPYKKLRAIVSKDENEFLTFEEYKSGYFKEMNIYLTKENIKSFSMDYAIAFDTSLIIKDESEVVLNGKE